MRAGSRARRVPGMTPVQRPRPGPRRGSSCLSSSTAPTSSTPGRPRRRLTRWRRRGRGQLPLGLRRQPLSRLLLPAGQRQHRPPAPQGRRGDPGAGGSAVHHRAAARQRRALRGGAADRRGRARRAGQGVLHQRRRRRDRERRAHGTAAHRPAQGAHHLPQLSRQHDDRRPDDRRPAPLAQRRRRDGHRPLLRALPLPLAVLVDQPGAGVRARARAPRAGRRVRGAGDHRRHRPRVDPRHGGRPRAARRLPRRRARDLRPRAASSTSPTR